ncbi:uncharacterized protein IL334_000311 [Kwoniella shivajii]|uniref:TKL/LISK/LISK-DD1 protein kinase n=1 Tax=Kwoniella shivajii TaxID=564305 RepID=A0ABZ1CP44_9TREE|nr:hypothetical protein IL334_000311 [Kwoniella shivajii]
MDFDIIPYEDIQWGPRLGAGSFGSVYKGSYLGINIAIKEVLPSTEYDVHKYFEREWRIMRECRHPNIVLFLGLSKAPGDDGRVFIISEFVPRGNLRQYILSPHPFPWRLRLSFATDVARAVAYLHARQCIHRDLKGENLLITSNERVKVTDFGFARIASRNAEEMRRMTYCGTDGYMSPEIINGLEFDLPTDVFSLGIIFIEIMSRKLVDSKTYTRQAPHFVPDTSEIQRRASPGCPQALISLALSCTQEDPLARPKMSEVLIALRDIELEVLSRLDDPSSEHVGSIRLVHRGGKRAMPIFDGGDITSSDENEHEQEKERKDEEEVLRKLAEIHLDINGNGPSTLSNSDFTSTSRHTAVSETDDDDDDDEKWRTARWNDLGFGDLKNSIMTFRTASTDIKGHEPLLQPSDSGSSFGSTDDRDQEYSSFLNSGDERVMTASVLRAASPPLEDDVGSKMTIRGTDTAVAPIPSTEDGSEPRFESDTLSSPVKTPDNFVPPSTNETSLPGPAPSPLMRKDQQLPLPTETSSNPESKSCDVTTRAKAKSLATHRFTLVERDNVPLINGKKALSSNFTSTFAFAFLPKSLTSSSSSTSTSPSKNDSTPSQSKCAVCSKRMGGRAGLQCDDCHLIVHVKCSHNAPRNCTGGDGKIH